MIPVSQPFMPPQDDYFQLISTLWESKWLTNNGAFVQQLEEKLVNYLGIPSLHFVSNGTMALQLGINSLGIRNEVITTPFSFVATTTSILWEKCEPVFVDINPKTLCIDTNRIEAAITEKTEAIMATHVFGIPCDVEKIEELASKYNLQVIYDAAHAFGVQYKGRSLLSYGNISTLSFHSTKLFHTVEGGGVINNSDVQIDHQIRCLRNFGLEGGKFIEAGINGKNTEFHAAMGLCNLKYIDGIIERRKKRTELYNSILGRRFERVLIPNDTKYNYAYYPIIFASETELLQAQYKLKQSQIETRRYFYPSLNTLSYLQEHISCPVSEDIARRILCLPLYSELELEDVMKISELIMETEPIGSL